MSKAKPVLIALMLAALSVCAFARDEEPKADAKKPERKIEYEEVEVPDDPAPPIKRTKVARPIDSMPGFLVLSNGDRVTGHVHLTRDAVLKFYDPKQKKLIRVRLDELTHIEQKVVVQRMEKEWRWLENANDQKVYTGRTYPMRKLVTVLHPKHGKTLTGPLNALLYVTNANGRQRFVIHKRQKGKVGTKLADLIYVKLVDFRPPEKKKDPKTETPAEKK